MRRVEPLEGNVALLDIDSRVEGLRRRWTLPLTSRRYGADRPLVVLTSATTFSGGEELAFDVRMPGRGGPAGRARAGRAPGAQVRRRHPGIMGDWGTVP